MKRGIVRHNTLQHTLLRMKTRKKSNLYIKSLSDELSKITGDSNWIEHFSIFIEIPFPRRDKNSTGNRVDIIFYRPNKQLITLEYKTTKCSSMESYRNLYLDQIERTTRNILNTISYAAAAHPYKYKKIYRKTAPPRRILLL